MSSRGPPVRHSLQSQLSMSLREQLLLPARDVFGVGWVVTRSSQGAASEMLPTTHDPTYSS